MCAGIYEKAKRICRNVEKIMVNSKLEVVDIYVWGKHPFTKARVFRYRTVVRCRTVEEVLFIDDILLGGKSKRNLEVTIKFCIKILKSRREMLQSICDDYTTKESFFGEEIFTMTEAVRHHITK